MPTIDLGYVIGPQGPQGATGATGATGSQGNPGPNQVTGSTSTTLNGILQGNGSVVSALQSDSTPTKDSNNAIRSGAVYNALNAKPNRNLLENAYFAGGGSQQSGSKFPINQRRQTTYNTDGFTIDRWQLFTYGGGTLTLNSGYIRLYGDAGVVTSNPGIRQAVNGLYEGCVVTISVLTNQGLESVTSNPLVKSNSASYQVSRQMFESSLWVGLRYYNDEWQFLITSLDAKIIAVKLEIGVQQTLATYKNGSWILTEIPDYGEELAKCQRYYQRWYKGDSYAIFALGFQQAATSSRFFLPLSVPLDEGKWPSITVNGTLYMSYGSGPTRVALSSFSVNSRMPSQLFISATSASSITVGTVGQIMSQNTTDDYIAISVE